MKDQEKIQAYILIALGVIIILVPFVISDTVVSNIVLGGAVAIIGIMPFFKTKRRSTEKIG